MNARSLSLRGAAKNFSVGAISTISPLSMKTQRFATRRANWKGFALKSARPRRNHHPDSFLNSNRRNCG